MRLDPGVIDYWREGISFKVAANILRLTPNCVKRQYNELSARESVRAHHERELAESNRKSCERAASLVDESNWPADRIAKATCTFTKSGVNLDEGNRDCTYHAYGTPDDLAPTGETAGTGVPQRLLRGGKHRGIVDEGI